MAVRTRQSKPPSKAKVFQTNDLVFEKVKGYPAWPACVSGPNDPGPARTQPGTDGVPSPGPGPQLSPMMRPPHSGGPPPTGSPMPPQMPPQSDLQKLQNFINQMEERGMTNDPRYNQARQLQQSMMRNGGGPGAPPGPYPGPPQSAPMPPGAPGPGGDGSRNSFQNTQMLQLRAQIMAYRFLARNQPLPPQIAVAVTGRRPEQQQPGGPGPQPGQPGYGAGSPMGPPNAQGVPGNVNAGSPRPPQGGPQGQQPGQQGMLRYIFISYT